MATHSLLLLPGDGIGVETIAEVERLITFLNAKGKGGSFTVERDLVGGAAYDKHGVAIKEHTSEPRYCDAIAQEDQVTGQSGRNRRAENLA